MNSKETLCTKNNQLALQVECVKKTNEKGIYLTENKREREREREDDEREMENSFYLHNISWKS